MNDCATPQMLNTRFPSLITVLGKTRKTRNDNILAAIVFGFPLTGVLILCILGAMGKLH